jgi:hypothetical protein
MPDAESLKRLSDRIKPKYTFAAHAGLCAKGRADRGESARDRP